MRGLMKEMFEREAECRVNQNERKHSLPASDMVSWVKQRSPLQDYANPKAVDLLSLHR